MRESRWSENEPPETHHLYSRISLHTQELSNTVEMVEIDSPEIHKGEKEEDFAQSVEAVSTVALDTETEPFTDKYSQSKTWVEFRKTGKTPVTPRTARMIGLALSYDGASAQLTRPRPKPGRC